MGDSHAAQLPRLFAENAAVLLAMKPGSPNLGQGLLCEDLIRCAPLVPVDIGFPALELEGLRA
jgi:hypothetical protein